MEVVAESESLISESKGQLGYGDITIDVVIAPTINIEQPHLPSIPKSMGANVTVTSAKDMVINPMAIGTNNKHSPSTHWVF
jgi:hypothetical protein